MADVMTGDSMMLMLAVSADSASLSASALAARCVVMSDDEQAVSRPMHGPADERRRKSTTLSFARQCNNAVLNQMHRSANHSHSVTRLLYGVRAKSAVIPCFWSDFVVSCHSQNSQNSRTSLRVGPS